MLQELFVRVIGAVSKCCRSRLYVFQEEMRRYQFSSPSVTEKEDFHTDTASTSLINNGKSSHHNAANNGNGGGGGGGGFFNGGLTALNGERARLFKKANSYGRPVREWYV